MKVKVTDVTNPVLAERTRHLILYSLAQAAAYDQIGDDVHDIYSLVRLA